MNFVYPGFRPEQQNTESLYYIQALCKWIPVTDMFMRVWLSCTLDMLAEGCRIMDCWTQFSSGCFTITTGHLTCLAQ